MKKMFLAALLVVISVGAYAQFEKGTKYINASLTGLDMSYSKDSRFRFGFEGTGGYFIEECWMPYGRIGFNHQSLKGPDVNSLEIGAGARYYFKRTGVYLSGGLLYGFEGQPGIRTYETNIDSDEPYEVPYTSKEKNNNISLAFEAGYCFYLNHFMSIEPAIYYNLCLNDFSDGSRVGFKIGLGFYF